MDQDLRKAQQHETLGPYLFVSTVVRARVDQTDGPAIRCKSVGRKRETIGHINKEKKAKLSEAKSTAFGCKNEKVEAVARL
jgi:hypothetical protein